MSEENNQPKENKLKALASSLGKKIISAPITGLRLVLKLISKLLKMLIWNPVTIGAVMFVLGARMHETGYLAGVLGKDLRGASVTVSGSCTINGKLRVPTLAEDQIKITYVDGEKIQGVVRKTRELVDCKLSDIAIDKIPLLAHFGKSPAAIPELVAMENKEAKTPDFKQLEKKTLVMTGSCVDLDGKTLPAFTDEKVDVTFVEAAKDSEDLFVLTGIKKADRQYVKCLSNSIKYEVFVPVVAKVNADGSVIDDNSQRPSYLGEMLLITGNCYPDVRTRVNKVKGYLFYKLANTRVQVLEEEFGKDDKLTKIIATIMDGAHIGETAVCQKSKFPFIYKEYDPDNTKLETKIETESGTEATPAQAPEAVPSESVSQ